MPHEKNRRVRILGLDPETVLGMFNIPTGRGPDCTFAKITLPDLPSDVEVLDVQFDFYRRQFSFLLTHPSFPEIPEGMLAPTVETRFEGVRISAYRVMPDLPHYPPPDVTPVVNGRARLVTWHDSLEEQMLRYGITGWNERGEAVWETGRGPSDGTIIVRPGYTGHLFQPEILEPRVEHGSSNLSQAECSMTHFDPPLTVNVQTNNPFDKTWHDQPPML